MDPILATGLVSLGKELIHKINSPALPPAQEIDFQALLEQQTSTSHSIASSQEIRRLEEALRNTPEVHALVSGDSGGFWLSQLEDGSFEISATSAGAQRLPSGSVTEALASELYALGKASTASHSPGDRIWVASSAR